MKKLLEIQNLNLVKQKNTILNQLTLNFYKGVSVFICGTSASGKTSLLKAIAGVHKYTGHILKYGKVEVIVDLKNDQETIKAELDYDNLNETQKRIVHQFINPRILENKNEETNEETKILIVLCKAFLKEPDLLFVDQFFFKLSSKNLKKVFCYAKKKGITLAVVSNDIEQALNFSYMIVLDQGRVAIEGKTLQVLEQEKILKRLGIGLPFYVDLSIQLKLYGLIQKIYVTKEELRGALWKK